MFTGQRKWADNGSFFSLPVGVPGGTGPNFVRFGTLGRDTFRGPGHKDFDVSLIKDTSFGRRGKNELGIVQFRAEFFNIFNVVNFALPSNCGAGKRVWNHKQNRGNFQANPVFFEADLLKTCNSQRQEKNDEDRARCENESSSDDSGLPDSSGHEFYAK